MDMQGKVSNRMLQVELSCFISLILVILAARGQQGTYYIFLYPEIGELNFLNVNEENTSIRSNIKIQEFTKFLVHMFLIHFYRFLTSI